MVLRYFTVTMCGCCVLEERSGTKSVEDWRCPSSCPHYSTHRSDVVTGDKRRSSSASEGQLAGETGQLAAKSPADTDESAVTVSTGEDQGLSADALTYMVATIGCVVLLLVVVGAASYATAACS